MQVKTKDQNTKIPMWTKSRLTLTHLMKPKRNLKDWDKSVLKITFKLNTSQQKYMRKQQTLVPTIQERKKENWLW